MNQKPAVLVVDDERLSRVMTLEQLRDAGFPAEVAENAHQALQHLETGTWDIVLTDLRMPEMGGLELLREIKQKAPAVDIILMTAYGSVETAVEAMREGAADYLTKPFHFEELEIRLARLGEVRDARREIRTLRTLLAKAPGDGGLIGRSEAMKKLRAQINTFANHDAAVLITGETGTGKELVARALHFGSDRSHKPFVPVTCGSIPRELAESELFGHEKGAFTHAIQKRIGSFERAHGGTLLLDDVDDLPLEIQVKLLRVLQEGTMFRVGGSEELQVDVRVVATSKVELNDLVASGHFRGDLFYRLRGLQISLTSLRERGDDVLLLAQHFLDRQSVREGTHLKTFSLAAAQVLRAYSWPGNVRELEHAIETALVLCRGEEVLPQHLPEFLRREPTDGDDSSSLFSLNLEHATQVSFNDLVQQFEESLLRWALNRAGGAQSQAAELLEMPRTTFQSKIGRPKQG